MDGVNLAGDIPPYSRHRSSSSRSSRRDPTILPQNVDPDTCRICRGESTSGEPLYYPCKCSGSIKYVHQDCLMEWLSHSQKKHCELCKTPFRFTKLYSPRMPSTLPTRVFFTHMARFVLDHVVTWLRALLVGCVWLFWVPYLMRRVWSLLFWLSDEGLGSLLLAKNVGTAMGNATLNATSSVNDTSVLSTIVSMAENQTAAQLLSLDSGSLNDTFGDSQPATRLPYLILGALFPALVPKNGTAVSAQDPSSKFATRGTLLSDVTLLQNLTRQPAVNRFVIMVLEGQVITVLVIICFILVILVRDYVVQQQPEINMRAAFAAAQDEARQEEIRREEREVAAPPPLAAAQPRLAAQLYLDTDDNDNDDDDFEWDSTDEDEDEEPERDARALIGEGEEQPHTSMTREEPQGIDAPLYRPLHAEEYKAGMFDTDTDQELIHLDVEGAPSVTAERAEDQSEDETSVESGSRDAMDSEYRPENASFIPTPSDSDEGRPSKGKSREDPHKEPSIEDEASRDVFSNDGDADRTPYSRRRAVSDGPQPREFANPLANNNWSFSPISTAAPSPGEHAGPAAGPSSNPPTVNPTDLPPVEEKSESSNSFPIDVEATSDGGSPHGRNGMDLAGAEAHNWEDEHPELPVATGLRNGAARHDVGAAQALQEDPRRPLWARVADFLWGDVGEDIDGADGVEPVEDDDAQDMPVEDGGDGMDSDSDSDLEIEEEAPDGLDQDALDDIEDFEGIMELVGMRGPLMGLFQNAVFCACLVFVTVFLCIFIPYNLGRTSITVAANPVRLVRIFFSLSKLIQDVAAVVVGGMSLSSLFVVSIVRRALGIGSSDSVTMGMTYTWDITTNASSRLSSGFMRELPVRASEIQNFSAISHDALLSLKGHVAGMCTAVWNLAEFLISSSVLEIIISTAKTAFGTALLAKDIVVATAAAILRPGAWIVDLERAAPPVSINPELASWSGGDRFWAILAGYISLGVVAGLYARRWAPISSSQVAQDWEASIIDVINQASGVTKVILIIGIEMLVFPLYCGLLMDGALLPLFEAATIKSRYEFTMNYPLTSMFVHWFVGTGYMFHFALFVSMCRKIMRKGVLYFIRDPDDPEFHPVRDVLERTFFTQLRKILFSALVYGGLVIICLGGVVWGLRLAFSNVLPIHYSSNEPVLEFPVDLLFYNFLMPLAVKILRPSHALHAMYTWWFRRCARMLRLTWFLFGRRQVDEEGQLVLAADSPHQALPWYRRMVLKIDDKEHVAPKSLREILTEMLPSTSATSIPKRAALAKLKRKLVKRGQLEPDGRFVRCPASDQVRVPKAHRVFLDVFETSQEPLVHTHDADFYYSNQYQLAYLPPNFKMRIFYFIFLLWVFAAVTGVGLTIVPLMVGRRLFKALLPDHVRTNDIYAFSIGIYVLGTLAYSVLRARTIAAKVRRWAARTGAVFLGPGAPLRTASLVSRWLQFAYAYFNIFVFFPLLASTLVELYIIVPLHTYLHPPRQGAAPHEAGVHTIRAVQAWTLGLLYLKLASRMLRSWEHSRLANASRAIFRRGYLRPDVPLLTRAFVLPAVLLALVAVLAPPLVVVPAIKQVLRAAGVGEDAGERALVYRVSFLVTATAGLAAVLAWNMVGAFKVWKARVRDEAYLVGERLHNFGGAKSPGPGRR